MDVEEAPKSIHIAPKSLSSEFSVANDEERGVGT